MNEWIKYAITGKVGDRSCLELSSISHVTHIDHAFQILKDQLIKKRFVYDKSKLTKKIEVVWLSCNDWSVKGYMYGTVRFTFDFKKFVKNKKFYWIEAITKYSPHACRILVTQNIYPELKLVEYDIQNHEGIPIKYDKDADKYYWNGNYTIELMFDDDIIVDDLTKIDFVAHHDELCNLKNGRCLEKNISKEKSSARLFSKIIKERLNIVGFDFTSNGKNYFVSHSDLAMETICSSINCEPNGFIQEKTDIANDIMRAILEEFYRGNEEACQRLLGLYKSIKDFKDTFIKMRKAVYFREIELKGKSEKKYTFKARPIFAPLLDEHIYVFCRLFPKYKRCECLFIGEKSNFENSQLNFNYQNCNCVIGHSNKNKEERENIMNDILNSHYSKLKKLEPIQPKSI